MNRRIEAFRKKSEALFYQSADRNDQCLVLLRESCQLLNTSLDHTSTGDDRRYISEQLEQALTLFETIKKKKNVLSIDEKLLYMSSRLSQGPNTIFVYPYTHDPREQDFVGFSDYMDNDYNDSESTTHGVSWIPLDVLYPGGYDLSSEESPQISQDSFNDCSVVASLISVINLTKRSPSFSYASNHIYPLTGDSKLHWVKVHLNGVPRVVEVDEYIPTLETNDKTTKLFLKIRQGPSWPLLAEKAYMKVMGGYGFKGSHSALDTFIFTGWLPEYIWLRNSDFVSRMEQLWNSIYRGWKNCDLMACVGTGHLCNNSDLYPDHDYSIVDVALDDTNMTRRVLVRDPWTQERDGKTSDNTEIWLDFESLHKDFDYLYLNWNPSLLAFNKSSTFIWAADRLKLHLKTGAIISNPQYKFENMTSSAMMVIFVLERHVSGNSSGQFNEFLGLSLYKSAKDSGRIALAEEGEMVASSPAIQSNYTTLRCEVPAKSILLLVLTMQSASKKGEHFVNETIQSETFTLTAHSSGRSDIYKAKDTFAYRTIAEDKWKSETAGGSWASDLYGSNPQFTLGVKEPSTLCKLYLFSDSQVAVAVHMFYGSINEQLREYNESLLVADSGKYTEKYTMTRSVALSPRNYTIVVSSYEKDVAFDSFWLYCLSDHTVNLRPAVRSYAGLYSHSLNISWSGDFRKELLIEPERKGFAHFKCKSLETSDKVYSPSLRISLYDDQSRRIASTTNFSDSRSGIFLDNITLDGSKTYIAVIERMESGNGSFTFSIYSSSPLKQPKKNSYD